MSSSDVRFIQFFTFICTYLLFFSHHVSFGFFFFFGLCSWLRTVFFLCLFYKCSKLKNQQNMRWYNNNNNSINEKKKKKHTHAYRSRRTTVSWANFFSPCQMKIFSNLQFYLLQCRFTVLFAPLTLMRNTNDDVYSII